MYMNDLCTIPSNLAGNASASFPVGLAPEDGLPVGLQVMAPPLADDRLYRVGAALEAALESATGVDRCWIASPSWVRSPMTVLLIRGGARGVRPGARTRGTRRTQHHARRCSAAVRPHSAPSPTPRSARSASVCRARCRCVNAKAVESAIRIGLALNCTIAEWCRFARKNYFYPDMPKNYQISQYDEPIAYDGWT